MEIRGSLPGRGASGANSLIGIFEEQAACTPDVVALLDDEGVLTYGDVDERANRLARLLVASRVGPDHIVGVCLEPSRLLLVAILGTLKAGAAWLPLDSRHPASRLASLCHDAHPRALITREGLRALLPRATTPIVIDAPAVVSALAALPRSSLADAERRGSIVPDQLAYVFYTSGSSGRPKGVAVSHAAASASLRARLQHYPTRVGTLSLRAPVTFDIFVAQMFWTWACGGTLVVPRAGDDPESGFVHDLQSGVTHLMLPASAYTALLASRPPTAGHALTAVTVGGEPLEARSIDLHREVFGDVPLFHEYGTTEASVWSSLWRCESGVQRDTAPIGAPIAGTQLHVLDAALQPCPPGVVGELYIAGRGLARGYHGRPALTAERFVANPVCTTPGDRLYRTGDLARWGAHGHLHFAGRADEQVKIRGIRVEPREVEAILSAVPGVGQAAVVTRRDGTGAARLVAYVVADRETDGSGSALDEDALRQRLAGRVPDYMVPSAIVLLDALPLTTNGKIDRRALPDPPARKAHEIPSTHEEAFLSNAAAALLGVPHVGPGDHFFDLGGHSLLAIQLVARIKADLRRHVPVRRVFEHPVLRDLARVLRDAPRAEAPLCPAARPERIPLSPAQARLWVLHQLEGAGPAYTIPLATRLAGALDVPALRDALEDVRARHDSLRTRLAADEEGPYQRVVPLDMLPPVLHATAGSDSSLNAALEEAARHPFDLAREPGFRATLVHLGADNHVLLLLLHHSTADEWSIGALLDDVSAAYAARRCGRAAALPPLPVHYADFAIREHERWSADGDRQGACAREVAWWQDTLAGLPVELALPADRPRPAVPSSRGGTVPFEIPATAHQRLHGHVRAAGATLFMGLHAAVAAWLTRLGAGTDIPIGTPVAGRWDASLERIVGFFANTLVLRLDTSGHPTFETLLARARAVCLDAYAHQELPFERIVEALEPARRAGRQPLFQTMLVLQHEAPPVLRLAGIVTTPVAVPTRAAKFDLVLTLTETRDTSGQPAGLRGALEYSEDLFDGATAERLARQFVQGVEQLVAAPGRPLRHLDLLAPEERARLLRPGGGRMPASEDTTLVELFEEQVERTPHAVAVVDGSRTITYAALDARANRLARQLVTRGAGPERRIALLLEPSVDMVVAMLAALKAGGAYLPIDPEQPDGRVSLLLDDALPVCVVTTRAQIERLPAAHHDGCVDVEAAGDRRSGEAGRAFTGRDRTNSLRPAHPAYVIYTSGSTGVPKGVVVTHGNVTRLFEVTRRLFAFDRHDVWTLFHSCAFDFSVWEIWGALLHGGRLVVVPRDVARSPEDFYDLLVQQQVTILNQTPSAFYRLMERDAEAGGSQSRLALRTVVFGGEALDISRLQEWYTRHDDQAPRLVNMYGITETTVHVTYAALSRERIAAGPRNLIGAPLRDLRAFVLDDSLQPCPLNVTGELYVSGHGLARGYWDRPALTATRFVANPFATVPGDRLYRTGDRAAWRSDGTLVFQGRADAQVKIRGFRIEPGEIESVILRVPHIAQAAVVLRQDGAGEPRLVAYVVARRGHEDAVDLHALRRHIAAALPDYMVPPAFVVLDALPLTRNGKLDRAVLPEPPSAGLPAGFVPPATPHEAQLCDIVAGLLGAPRVGLTDHFFHLGGHSLLAARLTTQVRQRMRMELPLRAVFEAPVIGDLSKRLTRRLDLPLPFYAPPRPAVLPLSSAQARFWFLYRIEGPTAAYNVPLAVRLRGQLDSAALASALDDVCIRHEILRTLLVEGADGPEQRILDPASVSSRLEPHDTDPASLQQVIDTAVRRPFELDAEPPLRAHLFRVAADDHALLIVVHHSAADGWSMGPLLDDLAAAYAARAEGQTPVLERAPFQYADYALWERVRLGRGDDPASLLARQQTYWQERLTGLPPELSLPYDRPRPQAPTGRCDVVSIEIDADLHTALESLASSHQATLFMVLQAALAAWLTRMGAGTDIPIGTPHAGRVDAALERIVGCFVNTLVLRTDTGGNPAFVDLLARVRRTAIDAYAHADIPFERVVELLDPPRVVGRQPLFQTMLALQPAPTPVLELPGVAASPIAPALRVTKFDLSFALTPVSSADAWRDGRDSGRAGSKPARLRGELEFNADIFDAASAERFAASFLQLLQHVVSEPSVRLHDISVMGGEERNAVVHAFNATVCPAPASTVVRDFEAQAARTPDATALAWPSGGAMSYGELNGRANALAWRLRALDVGPESRVAVWLERSPELVVAVLAVLKTGGAFVPIDPNHPLERIAFVLGDAAPQALLTTRVRAAQIDDAVATVCLDGEDVRAAATARPLTDADRTTALRGSHPAYVIYTSGSTGTPKGVVVSHDALAQYLASVGAVLGADAAAMPLLTAPAFDLTVTTLFAPLRAGGRITIVPEGNTAGTLLQVGPSTAALDALEAAFGPDATATAVKLTPSHVALLAARPVTPHRLRTVMVGGEALTPAHVATLRTHAPGVRIINEYGPTEATVGLTAAVIDADAITIGRPYPNTQVYVLDAALQPCPIGVVGELYLAGATLARGYWGRPALTATRFLAHPYAATPGARLYRSGDRAAWRPDGTLQYHGRADQQLKVRGVRVEPAEVEAALLAQPGVQQAAVVARADHGADARLVAYVVPRRDASGTPVALAPDALRTALAAGLPAALVPSAVVVLDALPLTVNGKLDRAALPAPHDTGVTAGYVAPTTPDGVVLCELVAALLGVPRVGLADHFFHLGGHSLLAAQLVAQLRTRLGRVLPLRAIFDTPRLGDLAATLRACAPQDRGPALVADPAAAYAPFPLTPVQAAYWLGRQQLVVLGDVACHVYLELQCVPLDVPRLEAAWRAVITRHPMLRTVITPDGQQRVLPEVPPFTIPVGDYRAATRAEADAAVAALRTTLSHQVLPADRWPLFDVRVTAVAADDWRLHLSIDALLVDGESLTRLVTEVCAIYGGRATPAPPTAVTFRDYVLYRHGPADARHDTRGPAKAGHDGHGPDAGHDGHGPAEAGHSEAARAYWTARLDTLPPAPALPLAVDPARLTDPRFGREHARLAPAVWAALTARAAAAGLTPATVLLTAYAEVLGTWARRDDFTLNLTVGDRRPLHPDVATMLGVFTTLTPLEVRGARRGAFRVRAHAQQRQLAADLDHRDFSGVEVQRLLAQRAGDPQAGLLPVVFTSVLGEPPLARPPEIRTVVDSITQTPQTWLDAKVYEQDGGSASTGMRPPPSSPPDSSRPCAGRMSPCCTRSPRTRVRGTRPTARSSPPRTARSSPAPTPPPGPCPTTACTTRSGPRRPPPPTPSPSSATPRR
jgi:amino acid adenylation domain-containing protein